MISLRMIQSLNDRNTLGSYYMQCDRVEYCFWCRKQTSGTYMNKKEPVLFLHQEPVQLNSRIYAIMNLIYILEQPAKC